jgi:hypothetical protein
MHVGAHKSAATNCFEVATRTPKTHMTIAAIVTKGAHFACKYESSLEQLNSHKEKVMDLDLSQDKASSWRPLGSPCNVRLLKYSCGQTRKRHHACNERYKTVCKEGGRASKVAATRINKYQYVEASR